mgnify:CR=1 FL=1
MRFEIGNYTLDVDVERTRRAYRDMPLTSEGCSCVACQNYSEAIGTLPDETRRFFDSLGMEMRKASEVYMLDALDDFLVEYGGFYHICGEIVTGESPWVLIGENKRAMTFHLDKNRMVTVDSRLKVGFRAECDLLPKGFPAPCFQMEISAHLPWLLGGESLAAYIGKSSRHKTILNRLNSGIKALFKK